MATEGNLRAKLEKDPAAARIYVAQAESYTKDGGAPTLTAACQNLVEFEREVTRLRSELDRAVDEAREHFGEPAAGAEPTAATVAQSEEAAPGADLFADVGAIPVRAVMTTDVKTLGPNEQLSLADELMKVGSFRHVVVVAEDGTVEGVVSRRDIFFSTLTWSQGIGKRAHEKALGSFPVKQVMSSGVETTHPDAPLRDAARAMAEHKVGCLPVIDEGRLVGILTEGDFLALITDPATGARRGAALEE